jgi:hypothetical protein
VDPKGQKLDLIVHHQPATTDLGFADDDWKALFTSRRTSA